MRHPLTGAGMSVALNDVAICQDLFKDIPDLHDQEKVRDAISQLYSMRKNNHSFVINVLSMALYELFAANDGKFV
jgi:squalene monooxygenase